MDNLTKRESDLMFHIGNVLADWIEEHHTDREEIFAALALIFHSLFCIQTPMLDAEEQCKEIDLFCEYQKFMSRKRKDRNYK